MDRQNIVVLVAFPFMAQDLPTLAIVHSWELSGTYGHGSVWILGTITANKIVISTVEIEIYYKIYYKISYKNSV